MAKTCSETTGGGDHAPLIPSWDNLAEKVSHPPFQVSQTLHPQLHSTDVTSQNSDSWVGAPPPGLGKAGKGASMQGEASREKAGASPTSRCNLTPGWAFPEQFQAPVRWPCFVKVILNLVSANQKHFLGAFSVGPATRTFLHR